MSSPDRPQSGLFNIGNPPPELMIIDNSRAAGMMLSEKLKAFGYTAKIFRSPKEALQACQTYTPNCILIDYEMPELTGPEFCQEFRKDERLQTIPILLVTGKNSKEYLIEAFENGANDCVTKSDDTEILVAKIQSHLRVASLQQAAIRARDEKAAIFDQLKDAVVEIERLAQFVLQAPGPIMGISPEGQVFYANNASDPIFLHFDIEMGGQLTGESLEMIQRVHESQMAESIEFESAGISFQMLVCPSKDGQHIHLYGRDVTYENNLKKNWWRVKNLGPFKR